MTPMQERKIRTAAAELIQDLQRLENLAHRAGMPGTAKAINTAKNATGWELAAKLSATRRVFKKKTIRNPPK